MADPKPGEAGSNICTCTPDKQCEACKDAYAGIAQADVYLIEYLNNDYMLNLKALREASVERAKEGFKTYDNVSLSFFGNALAGEVGELCNLIKKLDRAEVGGLDAGATTKVKDITPQKLKEEIGGIVIYLDLLAARLGISLEEAIIYAFNDKSIEYNLRQRLTADGFEFYRADLSDE